MENSTQDKEGSGILDTEIVSTVEKSVLFSALALSLIALAIWQTPNAVGSTAAGGLIAFLNLLVLRRTVRGILKGSSGQRVIMSLVLMFKMGLLLAAVFASVFVLGFDPLAVGLGASSLFIGVLIGSFYNHQLQQVEGRGHPER